MFRIYLSYLQFEFYGSFQHTKGNLCDLRSAYNSRAKCICMIPIRIDLIDALS